MARKSVPEPLEFRSHVGILTPFFVPRKGDTPPTATMSGPTGDHTLAVVESGDHPTFGARWQVDPPGPWWAEGDYTIAVSSGERYVVHVGPRHPQLRPAELKRLAALDPDQLAETLAAFGPRKEA
jgi:hypothetical protein